MGNFAGSLVRGGWACRIVGCPLPAFLYFQSSRKIRKKRYSLGLDKAIDSRISQEFQAQDRFAVLDLATFDRRSTLILSRINPYYVRDE